MELNGRLALVTGASRGIGAATAKALAAAGAHVVLTARKAADLESVEDAIHKAGGAATIAPMDLTDGDSIPRLAAALAARWDALDVLVLNAAMLGSLGPIAGYDAKEFARTMTLNVSAQAALLGAFDAQLRRAEAARVIGLTTNVAPNPRAFWGMYGASKAAFDNLLLSYADEVRNLADVRVALVDPGATATTMRARAYPGEDQASLQAPDEVAGRIVALIAADFLTGHRESFNRVR